MSQQHDPLTEREMVILRLIADGHSNQDIAEHLSLSLSTVKWHVLHVYQKLGARRRTQAVAAARTLNILPPEGDKPPDAGSHVPARLTPIIGREQELAAISRLVQDRDNRLVTIVGPGGVGKTRLALAVARSLSQQITGQLNFISLEALVSAEQVAGAIGGVLGLTFGGNTDLSDQIVLALRRRRIVLVLDNIEHLLPDAARLIGRMLESCPLLTVLGTSRERLKLRAETVFPLEGLGYPAEGGAAHDHPAVSLFTQTAKRSRPNFEPDQAELEQIARLCQLVEGLPLAIELAAGWVSTLPVDQITAEISHNLQTLTTQSRDAPDRHRSMEAVCAHSWQLLTDDERAAFMRMSVFRGGFDRAAAEAVAGATLPILGSLVDKSLVRRAGHDRYALHEILRQFAEERLKENPASDVENHERHCRHFGDRMEVWEHLYRTVSWETASVIIQIMADYDNIMTAWDYAITNPMPEQIARYSFTMCMLYNARGLHRPAATAFARALDQYDNFAERRDPQRRMCLLVYLGWYMCCITEHDRAALHLDEAVSLIRRDLDDLTHLQDASQALSTWGWNTLERGNTAQAKEAIMQGLALGRSSGSHLFMWTALCWLDMIAFEEGQFDVAFEHFTEARAITESRGDIAGMMHVLPLFASTQAMKGNLQSAVEVLQQTLEIDSNLIMLTSVILVLVGMSIVQSRLDGPVKAFETLALVLHHSQCGGPERRMARSLWNDLRAELPAAQAKEITSKAERGELTSDFLEVDFIADRGLLGRLSQVLDGYSRRIVAATATSD